MDGVFEIDLNEHNQWRADTPGGSESWARSPYPAAEKKYFKSLLPPATLS